MTAFPEFPKDAYSFSAAEVGQALAGLVARDAAGLPLDGMMALPAVAAVASSWKVQVGRLVFVRGVAGAVRFSGLSAAEQIDVTNAAGIPAGQSRIDRIAWNPAAAALVYVQGAPAVTPVAPSIGANAPCVRVVVQAGDGSVAPARVTVEAIYVGLARTPRPIATSSYVHYLGKASIGSIAVATGLAPVDYPRVLAVANGDLAANAARFEMVDQILPAGATSAVIGWTGAGIGTARANFTAFPVEP